MKQITKEEFADRVMATLRARQIFIDSGITNNISVAFELYQKVCAERERDIFLSTKVAGNHPSTIMDRYERPKCPTCGNDMMFRAVPPNETEIKTQLVCSNAQCDTVLDSNNDIQWWMNNLKVKNV